MASTLPCTVSGCKGRHLAGQVMCPRHWRMLSSAQQAEVHAAQRAMWSTRGPDLVKATDAFVEAREKAVSAVEVQEASRA